MQNAKHRSTVEPHGRKSVHHRKPADRRSRPGRPRADNDELTPRERILQAATSLFCRYGINAIGIDTVIEEAGTAKATLYNIFGSKETLVREVLIDSGRQWREMLFAELDGVEGDARQKLLTIFDVLARWFSDPAYYGCPFINALGEHDKLDNGIREITLAHKGAVLERIRSIAHSGGASDAERLTHELAIIIDGAIVAALITRNPQTADMAKSIAENLLDRELGISKQPGARAS